MRSIQSKNISGVHSSHSPFFQNEKGNHFFTKNNKSPFNNIQAKLTVNQPNDPYEMEADAMADKVVQQLSNKSFSTNNQNNPSTFFNKSNSFVQRKCAECEQEEKLQKKEDDPDLPRDKLQKKTVFETNEGPPDDEKNIQRKYSECDKEEMLQRSGPSLFLQKAPIGAAALASSPASASSTLPQTVVTDWSQQITANNLPLATDVVMKEMIRRGEIDPSTYKVQPTTGGADACKDPNSKLINITNNVNGANTQICDCITGQNINYANPRIAIHTDLVKFYTVGSTTPQPNATVLHANLLHEFRHVRQQYEKCNTTGPSLTNIGPCTDCNDPEEMDAYLAGVESGYEQSEIIHAWVRVFVNWDYLSPNQQRIFSSRKRAAEAKINRLMPGFSWNTYYDVTKFRSFCQGLAGGVVGTCNSLIAPALPAGQTSGTQSSPAQVGGTVHPKLEQGNSTINFTSPDVENKITSSKGLGNVLPDSTKEQMEDSFDADFSSVRIHNDNDAIQLNKELNAQAFTQGNDIYFNTGKYDKNTNEGKHLLAHELTHVIQQQGTGPRLNRKPAKPKKPTAADSPKLTLTPSVNGSPCACLVVVHNDERNARKIAEQMSQHCSYNLTLLEPDSGSREIKIPGQSGTFDPNSLFPPEIAKECTDNEQSCKDFLTAKSGSTDPDEIKRVTQIEFFLTMNECSQGFSLPVVALHNNDIKDTKEYLDKKDKVGVGDLKTDIDKPSEAATKQDQTGVDKLKELLKKKFGKHIKHSLTEEKGKTNIFRWCSSPDISKCHIGDPDHPDNAIWVINEKDYDLLSKQDLNVALQSELAKSKGSESEGDLSTLFLILKGLIGDRFAVLIQQLTDAINIDEKDILTIVTELEKLEEFHDLTLLKSFESSVKILVDLLDILLKLLAKTATEDKRDEALNKLRYINIEGPGKELSSQTDAERIRNYESIVEALKAVGLHCCGDDPATAENEVKQGLKIERKK